MMGRAGDRAVVVLADPACRDAVRIWFHHFSSDHVTILVVDGASDLGLDPGRKRGARPPSR